MQQSITILKRSKTIQQMQCTLNLLNCRYLSTNTEEKIEIPRRINRGPTDILRALEKTITNDPTAAHYKYHDDPYLIPMSNIGKRTFAMAQEAGRKAAQWVRKEHAEFFNHKEMDPVIKSFLPRVVYNEDSQVTEEDLKNTIVDVRVSDAVLVYKLLKQQGQLISNEIQQDLLDLLCYFNNDDTLADDLIEERWFKQTTRSKQKQRKIWKDGSTAEEIFISIENPTTAAYSAIIQGMCKYFQVDRAWELYEESQQKGITLTANTFNSLLKVVNFLKESYEMRWSLVVSLLSDMNRAEIKPNLGTLNAVLFSLSTMGSGKYAKDSTLKMLREFKNLGIDPSLGTWYYVLITYCKERGPVSTILHDIMEQVENKEHVIQDLSDTHFFVTAMDVCKNNLNDVELGKRINGLLHYGNNYDLIGDSYKESIYYRHYFTLLVNNIPLDEFMTNIYYIMVPNIYVPEPSVMFEVLKQVELNVALEYIPKLWSDMVIFDHTNRENIIESLLNIMVNNIPEEGSDLNERFACIGMDIYTKVESQNEDRFNKLTLTGEHLGNIMTLVLRNKEFEKGCTIMERLDKGQTSIAGVPKFEALSLFIDQCIENKSPGRAIACIQYCSESGFPEVNILAAKLNEKLTLDENYLSKLSKIIGDSAVVTKESQ